MIEVLDNSKDGIYNSNMELVDSFTDYSSKNLDFDKPVTIELMDDEENAKNPLGTTAHYNPDEMKITIYVTGRHIKDILRSISHELIHHVQNCRGDLSGMQDTSLGYAQRDKHMRDMEAEAFKSGNIMIFRDFEDNYKQRNRKMSKLRENRLRRLNQILMGDNKKLLKENEVDVAIRTLPRLFEKGASLDKIQKVLVRALGTGTRPNDPVVQNLMRQFGNLRKAGRLTANAGMSAIERATGRSLAGAAVRTGTQIVATKTGQKITQELVKRQAGREIIKRAAAGALARGAGRMAAGQAIGSAVPGFGNFVMAAIIGAGVVGDLMLIYYEREKLRMKGTTAGRNVRKKCKTLREKGFPVEEGTPEEYKELAKDFANAIAFSSSYLKLSSYRQCLRKLMSMPKGESYLRDAGISFDVVSPSDVGLSQEDIGGSQLAPGMTTIGGQSIGDASAYGTGGSQLAPGMTTVTGQAIGGLGAGTSQAAPRGRIKP